MPKNPPKPFVPKTSVPGFRFREARRGERESIGEVCAPTRASFQPSSRTWRTEENHGFVRVVLLDIEISGRRLVAGFVLHPV